MSSIDDITPIQFDNGDPGDIAFVYIFGTDIFDCIRYPTNRDVRRNLDVFG